MSEAGACDTGTLPERQQVAAPIYVSRPPKPVLEFSVVTLVASEERYRRLRESFQALGFDAECCEFIGIDNRDGNSFCGFTALRAVVPLLRGQTVLFTHDDVELLSDGVDALRGCLRDLDARCSGWMIAGNAGRRRAGRVIHIEDPHGSFRLPDPTPVAVDALDENFLVMPRARMPLPSVDLDGFHLFGFDMCLQARFQGGGVYVVPFLLRHHSRGKVEEEFERLARRMERKYTSLGLQGRAFGPTAILYFGIWGSVLRLMDRATSSVARNRRRLRRVVSPSRTTHT